MRVNRFTRSPMGVTHLTLFRLKRTHTKLVGPPGNEPDPKPERKARSDSSTGRLRVLPVEEPLNVPDSALNAIRRSK